MKNKQTKKRLGVLAVILMLIVAIGATAGTTLAKYIYSATVSDSATIAKWGYTVSANTVNLFSTTYNAKKIVSGGDSLDVNATANVVAPGTSNDAANNGEMTITLNGSADVAAKLTLDFSGFKTVWLNYNNEATYYPIKWYINDTLVQHTEENNEKTNAVDAQDIATAVAAKLPSGATAKDGVVTLALPAGTTNVFGTTGTTLKIKWVWEFTQEKTAAVGEAGKEGYKPATYYDIEDTILGALAAGKTTTLWTSADNGNTTTVVDISKYADQKDYNLQVAFNVKALLVQTNSAN